MYCTGFGDCFLLTFRYKEAEPKTLWIDFGVRLGTKQRMQRIAQDIRQYVQSLRADGKAVVDVLAITHEHIDHISGLKQAKAELDQITFEQVWFAWTENPQDELAREWRRQQAGARQATQTALDYLSKQAPESLNEGAKNLKEHLTQLAKFETVAKTKVSSNDFGLHPSYKQLVDRGKPVHYLSPGYQQGAQVQPGDVIGAGLTQTPGATVFEGARIYVLGPPKDLAVIKVGEPKQWEQTLHTAAQQATHDFNDSHFAGAGKMEDQDFWYFVDKSPFSERFVVPVDFEQGRLPQSLAMLSSRNPTNAEMPAPESRKVEAMFGELEKTEVYQRYFGTLPPPKLPEMPEDHAWRRIDNDYVYEAGDLAIRLNNGMNNTSLVLAIELDGTKEVLFFSGDAEYGVWNDWEQDQAKAQDPTKPAALRKYSWKLKGEPAVTVEDLLSRTVFYKMGHHGSENATPKSKGIDKLSNKALHSMIPVDEATAKNFQWNRIPFQNLLAILDKRQVAYVRADKSHEDGGSLALAQKRTDNSPLGGRAQWHAQADGEGKSLFVEWTLSLK
jgi:hypothetical protein